MFFAKYILKDRITQKLVGLKKNIKDSQENIDIEKSRLYAIIYDIRLALEECSVAYRQPMIYTLLINTMVHINKNLENVNTAIELKQEIDNISDLFIDFDYQEHYSGDLTYAYRGLENTKVLDVQALDPIIVELEKQNRNITIFEPNCGQGDAMQYLGTTRENFLLYGTEDTSDIAIAKEYATKVAKGELKGSKIKNDAFDLLIAKCNIRTTLVENMNGGSLNKYEKEYITYVNKYLRPNGIVLFVLPYYRLHKDICEHIAKYYDNVRVVKSTGAYWHEKRYVYIYGQRSSSKEMDESAYEKLRACFNPNNIPELSQDMKLNYILPSTAINIDIFKGSVLDMEELHDIVNNSGAMDAFFDTQKVEKVGASTTKPLLPFNIGQLGLVLTSGCLDGIIDEGDGHYHLVKGKVSKKSDTVTEVVNGVIEETETVSNRVEINILLPDGEFKVLS